MVSPLSLGIDVEFPDWYKICFICSTLMLFINDFGDKYLLLPVQTTIIFLKKIGINGLEELLLIFSKFKLFRERGDGEWGSERKRCCAKYFY